ncbi:MAG: 16S rRNA (uracil(1498)-N(3))-methyltransferase [Bacteroidales bacterium]|nr:16S rRNA (uracil(1498)-N(3))-methyltransferase [Bacteroidales bacterium]
MQLFYTPDINSDEYTLDEQESKHCIKVLRKRSGDTLHLIDGKGGLFTAEIVQPNHKACSIKIIDVQRGFEKRNFNLHIAIAPTKNIERFEWFLEKAVEIGIDEITPLVSEKSERKQVNPERLERIIVSAMKQSVKAYKPVLNMAVSYTAFFRQTFPGSLKYIAHCNESHKDLLKNVYQAGKDAVVLIGPEGDFSEGEVKLAAENGFIAVSLGNSRLRTETAGVVACHTLNLMNC